jgi:hypothetical protein
VLEAYAQTNTCPPFWATAFEGQRKAAASGFIALNLDQPFVYSEVTKYQSTTGTALTDQTLEDIVLPVSQEAREETPPKEHRR